MPLMINPTRDMTLETLEEQLLSRWPDITVTKKSGALSVESQSWEVHDRIQSLLAKMGIPAENMRTVHPQEMSFVVGKPMGIFDADAA